MVRKCGEKHFQVRNEERTQDKEDQFRDLIQSIPIGIHRYKVGPGGKLVFNGANPAADKLLGSDSKQLLGQPIEQAFPFCRNTQIPERYYNTATTGEPWQAEQMFSGTAAEGPFMVRAFQTSPGNMAVAFVDITARSQADTALREAEEKYRLVVEHAAEGILIVQNDILKFVNPHMLTISGYSEAELLQKPAFEFVHPDDRARVNKQHLKRMRGELKPARTYRFRIVTKAGKTVWMKVTGSVTGWEGKPVAVYFLSDITKRKKTVAALRESEKKYKELADSLPQTVFEFDETAALSYANSIGLRTFGYTQEDLKNGLNALDMVVPEDRERAREHIASTLRGERKENVEYTALRKDGSAFPAAVHSNRVLRDKKPVGLRGLLIDMSERKRFETEVLKTQKLESLGILAGGIAHDFNNMLTAIVGNLHLARTQHKPSDEIAKRLEEAEKTALNARDLTQQLLTFAKGGAPIRQTTSLADLIKDSTNFALSGSNVRCACNLAADLHLVDVDAEQIRQAFNNLIINARQAMPEGGLITISAENVLIDAQSRVPLKEGAYIKITCTDQGTGIPGDHLLKIFDPYFTTKQKNSGLGLSVTHSIIQKHDGAIQVESGPGGGTTFTLYLPASRRQTAEKSPSHERGIAGKARVLLMDDEAMIREAVGDILKRSGYDVECAEDGAEAIRVFQHAREEQRPFDAVIMDLTVPGGMGGKEATQKLRTIAPELKAIVSSGYSNDPIMANFRDYGFSGVIAKPYRATELNRILRHVITGLHGQTPSDKPDKP